MKIPNLKIVENAKKFFIVPAAIILIAIIMLFVYGFSTGNAVNVGMDFTGGYKMRIQLGSKLTDDTYADYSNQIVSIVEDLKNDEGESYGIKVEKVERIGEDSSASITIHYRGVASNEDMEAINEQMIDELEKATLNMTPAKVTYNGNFIVATYDCVLNGNVGDFVVENLAKIGVTVVGAPALSDDNELTIEVANAVADDKKAEVESALIVDDPYAGNVGTNGYTSSTVSSELLQRAALAVALAVVLMLIYITIRFELLSGLAAIIALVHDVLILICGMFIFHLPFNSTIVAALITILGYSINNTIIIFDRVRENIKTMPVASHADIVNTSVKNTLTRTICTTFTTLIMIVLVAIIGVTDIRIFALPIIFGLVAGFYSANFIAPSVWAWLSKTFSRRNSKSKRI